MPLAMRDRTLLRLGLVGAYFVLALGLNVLLLEHELSAHGPAAHPDQDVCAWLDHAGGVSIHSDRPVLVVPQGAGAAGGGEPDGADGWC